MGKLEAVFAALGSRKILGIIMMLAASVFKDIPPEWLSQGPDVVANLAVAVGALLALFGNGAKANAEAKASPAVAASDMKQPPEGYSWVLVQKEAVK